MPDWSKSMQQSFEYYIVNPNTWKDMTLLTNVKSCTINRDIDTDTLGSATIDIVDPVGECYIRVYLVTVQNGISERHPLGTFLVQTPSSSYDGKTRNVSMDAYTPLFELKEKQPPLGYYIPKTVYYKVDKSGTKYIETKEELKTVVGSALKDNQIPVKTTNGKQVYTGVTPDGDVYYCLSESVMDLAYRLVRENMRAPVVPTDCSTALDYDFVSDTDDTWFSFLRDLAANSSYEFALDEMSRVLFSPVVDAKAMQPTWTYSDDNSSILYPDLTTNHDLSMIPNVVQVLYSTTDGMFYVEAKNEDTNSPTSIQNRGREIVYRVTNPNVVGKPTDPQTKGQVIDLAKRLLKELSAVEYTASYSHGYCPVRLNDCVRLNYTGAGLSNVKAKVVSQTIKCGTGCKVTEKAAYSANNISAIKVYDSLGKEIEE